VRDILTPSDEPDVDGDVFAVPRMAENRLVPIITVVHDNLFSYGLDHSPRFLLIF